MMVRDVYFYEKLNLALTFGIETTPEISEVELNELLDSNGLHLERRLIERLDLTTAEVLQLLDILRQYEQLYANKLSAFGIIISTPKNQGVIVYRLGKWRTVMLRGWKTNNSGIILVVGKITKQNRGFNKIKIVPPVRFDTVQWRYLDKPKYKSKF